MPQAHLYLCCSAVSNNSHHQRSLHGAYRRTRCEDDAINYECSQARRNEIHAHNDRPITLYHCYDFIIFLENEEWCSVVQV